MEVIRIQYEEIPITVCMDFGGADIHLVRSKTMALCFVLVSGQDVDKQNVCLGKEELCGRLKQV